MVIRLPFGATVFTGATEATGATGGTGAAGSTEATGATEATEHAGVAMSRGGCGDPIGAEVGNQFIGFGQSVLAGDIQPVKAKAHIMLLFFHFSNHLYSPIRSTFIIAYIISYKNSSVSYVAGLSQKCPKHK